MVSRSPIINYAGNPKILGLMSTYYVKTDEPYEVQYGDRTIEIIGDHDLIFDKVMVHGYSFWVIRHILSNGAPESQSLKGYVYDELTGWSEVSEPVPNLMRSSNEF